MSVIGILPEKTASRLRSSAAVWSVQTAVRELLVNSLDAGASFVSLKIDLASLSVCVEDNGAGVSASGLGTLGKRHHTSKPAKEAGQSPNEMAHNGPAVYGCKGEALASIADVCSALLVQSKGGFALVNREESAGLRDVLVSFFQADASLTTVIASRLFHDLPVRHKVAKVQASPDRVAPGVRALVYELFHDRPQVRLKASFMQMGQPVSFLDTQGCSSARLLFEKTYSVSGLDAVAGSLDGYSLHCFFGVGARVPRVAFFNKRPQSLSPKQIHEVTSVLKTDRTSHGSLCMFALHVHCPELTSWPHILRLLRKCVGKPGPPRNSPQKPGPRPNFVPEKALSSTHFAKDHSVSASALRKGDFRVISQVEAKFILVTIGPVLYAVDQHACDERIRLEQYLREYISGVLDCKTDLRVRCPAAVDIAVSEAEAARFLEAKEQMYAFGVDYEVGEKLTVTHLPTHLGTADRQRLKAQLLQIAGHRALFAASGDWFSRVKHVPEAMVDAIASSACRQSIRFGDTLSPAEMVYLLTQLGRCYVPFQCAHGRPTIQPLAATSLGHFSRDTEV